MSDTYIFDAFGNLVTSTGSTVNPFRYVGQLGYYNDSETGNVTIGVRPYDPVIARWRTIDPLDLDVNLYLYVGNRPVLLVDPSGLQKMVPREVPFPLRPWKPGRGGIITLPPELQRIWDKYRPQSWAEFERVLLLEQQLAALKAREEAEKLAKKRWDDLFKRPPPPSAPRTVCCQFAGDIVEELTCTHGQWARVCCSQWGTGAGLTVEAVFDGPCERVPNPSRARAGTTCCVAAAIAIPTDPSDVIGTPAGLIVAGVAGLIYLCSAPYVLRIPKAIPIDIDIPLPRGREVQWCHCYCTEHATGETHYEDYVPVDECTSFSGWTCACRDPDEDN